MGKIVVVGSANMDYVIDVDRLPNAGETILSKGLTLICGGKGANQAYTLGRIGANITMLGAVGNDSAGDKLIRNLKSVGVNVSNIRRSSKCTGTAFIPVSDSGENTIIVEQGANKDVTVGYIDENIDIIKDCDIVIMQLEIPLETVCHTARRAKELGKIVILDPAPAIQNLPLELITNTDIIKPNETELEILTGLSINSEEDALEAAKLLLAKGTKTVILTLGENGALLCNKDGIKKYPGKNVKVIDTTAAGDSFTAAVAFMLSEGQTIHNAILFAIEISALTVTRKGAQDSIPSKDEAREIYHHI